MLGEDSHLYVSSSLWSLSPSLSLSISVSVSSSLSVFAHPTPIPTPAHRTSRDYTEYSFESSSNEVRSAIRYLKEDISWSSEENSFALRFAKMQGRVGWTFRFDMRKEMVERQ